MYVDFAWSGFGPATSETRYVRSPSPRVRSQTQKWLPSPNVESFFAIVGVGVKPLTATIEIPACPERGEGFDRHETQSTPCTYQ